MNPRPRLRRMKKSVSINAAASSRSAVKHPSAAAAAGLPRARRAPAAKGRGSDERGMRVRLIRACVDNGTVAVAGGRKYRASYIAV